MQHVLVRLPAILCVALLLLSASPPAPAHAAAPVQDDGSENLNCTEAPFAYAVDWVQQVGTPDRDRGLALRVNDSTGQLFVAGATRGSLAGDNAGGSRTIDRDDLWYGDWDPSTGIRVWWEQTGTDQADIPYGMALQVEGDNGGDSLTYLAGRTGLNEGYGWVERFNPLGETDDAYAATIPNEDRVRYTPSAIAVDNSGAAYWGGTRLDGGTSASSGWVRRYSRVGAVNWSRALVETHSLLDLAARGDGGFVAVGMTPRIDNDHDGWVASFDVNGGELWRQFLRTDARDEPTAVAVAGDGNIYVAGNTGGDLAGVNGGDDGSNDVWLAKYDASGNRVGVIQFGTAGADTVSAMAIAPDTETIVLVGSTAADLAGDSSGLTDMWVAEFDGDLTLLGCLQLGTSGIDTATDVAVDADGALYLAGYVNLGAWAGFENQGGEDAVIVKISGVVNDPLAELVFVPRQEGWALNAEPLTVGTEAVLTSADRLTFACPVVEPTSFHPELDKLLCQMSYEEIDVRCNVDFGEEYHGLKILSMFGAVGFLIMEFIVEDLGGGCDQGDGSQASSVATDGPDFRIELPRGMLTLTQYGTGFVVETTTDVGTIRAANKTLYSIAHNADDQETTVISLDGAVSVLPTAKPLEVILQDREMVTITATDVGQIIRLKESHLPYVTQ